MVNLKKKLAHIQASLVANPHSMELREAEISCLKAYKSALKDEDSFLKQKSKTTWLNEGDKC